MGLIFLHKTKVVNQKSVGLFRCDCGTEFETVIERVKRGGCTSCGCTRRRNLEVGAVFERLTVLKVHGFGAKAPVDCVCSCGKPVTRTQESLKKKGTGSCGCLHAERIGNVSRKWGELYELGEKHKVPHSTVKYIAGLHGEEFCKEYIVGWASNISDVELYASRLLDMPVFRKGSGVGRYQPDFKLSDKLFLDVDGMAYHTAKKKGENYHFDKRKAYEDAGCRLIQIYAPELFTKPDVCRSIILNAMGKIENKIYARKCTVELLEDSQEFFNKNHLMGAKNASTAYCLKCGGEVVAAMSVHITGGILEVDRLCNKPMVSVVGGLSKLLAHVESIYKPNKIVNYVDLRYGTGKHLLGLGFTVEKEHMGYGYTDNFVWFPRTRCQAGVYSEEETATMLKLSKVCDAGQRKYIKLCGGNHVKGR